MAGKTIRIPRLLKSIGIRLTLWYTLAVTITLVCVFVAGYLLLQNYLIRGLDLQIASQFKSVKVHLSRGGDQDSPEFIEKALRVASNRNSSIFFYDIRNRRTGTVFLSENLRGKAIPGARNEPIFDVKLDDLDTLRVGTFEFGPFSVRLGTPLSSVRDTMLGFTKICLALLAGMMLMSVAIGFAFSRLALNPIRLISETANRIRSDNLNERIPVPDVHDEVSDLARMLNQMFDRLESSFKQIRQFAAEASHELKSPLSLVRLHAEKMLLDGGLSPPQEEALRVQLEELARLDQIIEEMLFLSRAEARAITLDLKSVDPARFLQSFAQDARVLAEHYGMRFNHTHAGEGQVAFDEKRLRQVLLNLLSNALNVSPTGGLVTVRSLLDQGVWRLSIEDQGPGLPSAEYERIFERFVRVPTTGPQYKGSGLGLAICRSIVGLHQGRIFAAPAPGDKGLQMVLEIPATGFSES
ncbi:MAG: ATP-binding protein [Rhodoferax sp.]|uniref:ATP-binding protein n=1 Tax=Rhodoferax sp. TaxID=50421 RepID=UPI0026171E29|nr:ATP-binding protein [Rhodoferax sp.]MDD5336704.1 ATP-binding protein [Rhodoferax sp.]